MKRFKHILYFADGEQQLGKAFDRALQLAAANQARLCVFDVIAEATPPPGLKVRLDEALREMREEALTELLAAYPGLEPRLEVNVVTGTGFVEVIRRVLCEGHDLVIKASRPASGFSERVLGSADMHLLRKCPCPVWINRPDQTTGYRNILAAVDPQSSGGYDCATKVLTMAASMAAQEQARLTVVHAWHLYGESALKNGFSRVSATELELLLREAQQLHQAMLNSLIKDCGLVDAGHEVKLIKGSAAQTIRELSEQIQADLIVMGTVGRCGIPGFIIGNTAETVLQATTASILAVKPDAFVSPVTLS